MPYGSVLLGRSIALALLGVDVKNLRTLHLLYDTKDADKFHHVMSVCRTKIADVHTLEYVALARENRLDAIVEAYDSLASALVEYTP